MASQRRLVEYNSTPNYKQRYAHFYALALHVLAQVVQSESVVVAETVACSSVSRCTRPAAAGWPCLCDVGGVVSLGTHTQGKSARSQARAKGLRGWLAMPV